MPRPVWLHASIPVRRNAAGFGSPAREIMVAIGHADEGIRPVAPLVLHHHRGETRGVGLHGEGQQIVHEFDVIRKFGGDAFGLFHGGTRPAP